MKFRQTKRKTKKDGHENSLFVKRGIIHEGWAASYEGKLLIQSGLDHSAENSPLHIREIADPFTDQTKAEKPKKENEGKRGLPHVTNDETSTD